MSSLICFIKKTKQTNKNYQIYLFFFCSAFIELTTCIITKYIYIPLKLKWTFFLTLEDGYIIKHWLFFKFPVHFSNEKQKKPVMFVCLTDYDIVFKILKLLFKIDRDIKPANMF